MRDTSNFISFKTFQLLGYFVGGMIPIAIFLGIEKTGTDLNFVDPKALGFIFYGTLLAFILGLTVLFFEPEEHGKTRFNAVYSTQAFVSCSMIHFLVLYTGGPSNSVFSFSYLYLPSVVGYTYGRKDKNFLIAALVLAGSFFANLFFLEQQQHFFNPLVYYCGRLGDGERSPNIYCDKVFSLIMFIIQLFVTGKLTSKVSLAMRLKLTKNSD
jgi:uncharacterized membrane protein